MNIRSFFLAIIFSFIFGGLPAFSSPVTQSASADHDGQTATVTVTASEDTITISESLVLKIDVTVPEGYTAKMPSFEAFGFSLDFSERSKRFRPTDIKEPGIKILEDGSKQIVQEYTLEPWLSGNYSILPIMISFYKEKKESDTGTDAGISVPAFNIMTDGFRINVTPMPEERKELTDIYGQSDYLLEKLIKRKRRKDDKSDEELKREKDDEKEAAIALKDRKFPWWIVWTLLSVMILFPLYWFFGRKKIKEIFSGKKIPAHEIAYGEFMKLAEKDLLAQGKIKEYYYELSYILRRYIGNRFHLYAEQKTTEEFFKLLLEENPFDQNSDAILREFCDFSDTVKYSLYRPDIKTAEDSYKTARSFVDQTKVIEEDGK